MFKKGKISPWYVGPYKIISCIGKVAYELDLQSDLTSVHLVFPLRNIEIDFVKVLWRTILVEGATWEAEVDMLSSYPHIFPSTPILA